MVFKTLKSGIFSLERSLRNASWRRAAAEGGLLIGLILGLEFLGRQAANDVQDLALLFAATPVLLMVFYLHHKRKSHIVARLSNLFRAGLRTVKSVFQMEVGADFRPRKEPDPGRNVPYHDLKRFLLAALVFNLLVIPFHHVFPNALRTIGEYTLYTPYLLLTSGLWAILLGVIALDIAILVILFMHYVMKSPYLNPRSAQRRRRFSGRFHAARTLVLCGLIVLLAGVEIRFGKTGWFWLMGATAVLSLGLAFVPRKNENVALLIKRPSSDSIQSISISEWNFSFFSVIQGLSLGLFVIATGAGWGASEASAGELTMPCTYFLGRLFAACTSFATLFYLFATLEILDFKRLQTDPAREAGKKLLYRDGHLPADLKVEGWAMEPVSHIPVRDEADLYFDHAPERLAASGVPPFKKSLLTIPPKDRAFYLDRADFITKRRIFFRGLARLLKICRASSFRDGSGFIMIPHCYFVEGLHRDDRNEHIEEDRIIGPDFQELWGIRVRRLLYEVLEAMDIDIVYFEDSIRYKDLKAVFEVIFELYHGRGPNFRLEEHHFIGLIDTRVIVELIRPDLPREEQEGYPETHFTNLAQARILMVFKERGGGRDSSPVHSPGMEVPERT